MVSSPIGICKLSLDLLKSQSITSIEIPKDATEALVSRWYDHSRRKALQMHTWNFATKRAVLAAEDQAPAFGYSQSFVLPADCLRLMYVSQGTASGADLPMDSELYSVENGRLLMDDIFSSSDGGTARIVYTSDVKTVTKMTPLFIDYLVASLAMDIAYSVNQSNSTLRRLDAVAEKAYKAATKVDGQEKPPVRVVRSPAALARGGKGSAGGTVLGGTRLG